MGRKLNNLLDRLYRTNDVLFRPKTKEAKHLSIKILTIISFAVIFTVFSTLYLQYEPESEILNEIRLQPLAKEFELVSIETKTNDDGTETISTEISKERMKIQVTFLEEQIVANKPMPVTAKFLFPSDLPDDAWDSADENHILAFPGSENIVDPKDPTSGGIIKMKKSNKEKLYYGNTELIFPIPGKYGYVILHPSDVDSVQIDKNFDGTSDLSMEAVGTNVKIYPDSEFSVLPVSPILELNEIIGNKYLTIFLIGATLIGIHKEMSKGIIWISDRF